MTSSEKQLTDYTLNMDAAIELEIPFSSGGVRLDSALASLMPDYSRSRIQDWIKQSLVQVNGRVLGVKDKVWGGEKVTVQPEPHPAELPAVAEDIPLDIIYEDDSILVLNKPVGLVVHPGSGNWQGTLLNALLFYFPAITHVPRAGIVHRLDKDTSGLMVVAKTLTAQTHLVRQLQSRSVKREYLAVTHGVVEHDGVVDAPIGRHPTQRIKMAVVSNGREAVTRYTVLRRFARHSLLRCALETGRTHQIRVHMTSIGYPLVGDATYHRGQNSALSCVRDFPRQALHATQLGLVHPVTGEDMVWQVDPPADFADLLICLESAELL
ncbi:23S rRNA pseudouridine(1911/1915/1917) synthase RluD [Sulfuriferula nivalis]|uniref:Pseudouridine synthase n=1 Tax=Sulfuriferula nivalis TaxID=2675298 RepID=A0A809S9H1_9PROT|nr:23S rRNA pseudouridine(1911/1915/1917) synthase RluD [Sulfuriferula nivalis]BBP01253.1 pseudouridine synthase [Sulfuriferula nivalis]